MNVVITSATEKEILQIKQAINPLYTEGSTRLQVSFVISGVGMLSSCFQISKLIFEQKPELVIQAGIAGSFDEQMALSKVVAVKDEYLGDLGVEENGNFTDIFDLHLQEPDSLPFKNKSLHNPWLEKLNLLQLDTVNAVTINEITTRKERIAQLRTKYNPQIESMEGAALHYCCLQTETPFIQIRAISNYIGERDKSKWQFKASFDNLTSIITSYLDRLYTIE